MAQDTTSHPESVSKVESIQRHFRTQIRQGKLVAGDRVPPERELASQFGVSLLTVNKAMAGLESEMLLDRATSRGTHIHSSVSRGQVMVVFDALHFANPETSAFYHRLLESLTGEVKGHGMRPHHLLGHGKRGPEFVASLEPQSSLWRHASGVLAMASLAQLEDQLIAMGVPVVSITAIPGRERHPVLLDMNSVIEKAYHHLVSRGARRIALITHNHMVDGLRFIPDEKGCLSLDPDLLLRMSAQGPGVDPDMILTQRLTPRQGYEAMVELWAGSTRRPDGLILTDDNLAIGVGQAVRDLEIRTPGQLKIVTHATDGVERDFPLDFTRCQFTLRRICAGALGLLYRLMIDRPATGLTLRAAIRQGATT